VPLKTFVVVVATCYALCGTSLASATDAVYVLNAGSGAPSGGPEFATGVFQYTAGVQGTLTADSPASVRGDGSYDGLVVSPNGRYVYLESSLPNDVPAVYQYTIGSDGRLIPDSVPFVRTTYGDGMAVSPSGRFAYLLLGTSSNSFIGEYAIGVTGMLSPKPTATVKTASTADSIAVSPNGQYAYVADGRTNTVWQYTVGADGQLAVDAAGTVKTGESPYEVVVSPNGRYVYVVDNGPPQKVGVISEYAVGSGGRLIPDQKASVAAGVNPGALVVSPTGRYVYASSSLPNAQGAIYQYTVASGGMLVPDPTTAVHSGRYPPDLAMSPGGRLVYVANETSSDSGTVFAYKIGPGGMLVPPSDSATSPATPAPGGIGAVAIH
jgi:6-phosphogluconolactonase (cycloisomerase 2 family)